MEPVQRVTLPQDIFELILEELILPQDSKTMKACSTVSRSFLPLACRHLFASISLNPLHCGPIDISTINSAQTHRFAEVLSLSPQIASYVRKLEYRVITNLSMFLPELRTFGNLQYLKIWYQNAERERLDWSKLCPSLRAGLLQLIHLPSLHYLHLKGISNFPVTDLAPCTNLLKLELHNVLPPDLAEIPQNLLQTSLRLKCLKLGVAASGVLERLMDARCMNGLPFIDLSYIRRLSCWFGHADDVQEVATRRLVEKLDCLECLELHCLPKSMQLDFAAMISQNANTLREIRCSFDQCVYKSTDDPYLGLCDKLNMMPNKAILETLKVNLNISHLYRPAVEGRWGRLPDVLSKSSWPRLQRVSIHITLCRRRPAEEDDEGDRDGELEGGILRSASFKALQQSLAIELKDLMARRDLDFSLSFQVSIC